MEGSQKMMKIQERSVYILTSLFNLKDKDTNR